MEAVLLGWLGEIWSFWTIATVHENRLDTLAWWKRFGDEHCRAGEVVTALRGCKKNQAITMAWWLWGRDKYHISQRGAVITGKLRTEIKHSFISMLVLSCHAMVAQEWVKIEQDLLCSSDDWRSSNADSQPCSRFPFWILQTAVCRKAQFILISSKCLTWAQMLSTETP